MDHGARLLIPEKRALACFRAGGEKKGGYGDDGDEGHGSCENGADRRLGEVLARAMLRRTRRVEDVMKRRKTRILANKHKAKLKAKRRRQRARATG